MSSRFEKWTPVQWFRDSGTDDKLLVIKIRALLVDGRVKEYALGVPQERTERLFRNAAGSSGERQSS